MSIREYVFKFANDGNVTRIPHAKWSRIREGDECIEKYAQAVYIAYAYIFLENRKPEYCPRIEGAIYYFDESGYMVKTLPKIDILKEMEEMNTNVIDFYYHKEVQKYLKQHQWQLASRQIQAVIDSIWR